MIALEALTKRYGAGPPAVDALSLEVVTGEVCCLIGPSGSGKSTTLRMINRLIEPTSGKIWLDGEDVTSMATVQLRRRMGYVIQQVGLFPHRRVADNVATVPRLLGWEKAKINARVTELLELVGLDRAAALVIAVRCENSPVTSRMPTTGSRKADGCSANFNVRSSEWMPAGPVSIAITTTSTVAPPTPAVSQKPARVSTILRNSTVVRRPKPGRGLTTG